MGWDDTTHQMEDRPLVCARGTVLHLPQLGIDHSVGHLMLDAAEDTVLHMGRHGQAIPLGFNC